MPDKKCSGRHDSRQLPDTLWVPFYSCGDPMDRWDDAPARNRTSKPYVSVAWLRARIEEAMTRHVGVGERTVGRRHAWIEVLALLDGDETASD